MDLKSHKVNMQERKTTEWLIVKTVDLVLHSDQCNKEEIGMNLELFFLGPNCCLAWL